MWRAPIARFGLIVIAFWLAPAYSADDSVTLPNGRQVHGRIVAEDNETVTFQAPSGKRYKLNKTKLKAISHGAESRAPASAGEAASLGDSAAVPPSGAGIYGGAGPLPLRVGLQLGTSMSSMSASTPLSLGTRTGLMIGASIELLKLYNFIYLQPELMYEQLGFSFAFLNTSTTYRYDVFRLPILAKAKGGLRGNRDPLQFIGFLGPSFGFKVGSSSSTTDSSGNTTTSSTNTANFFTLALEMGAGAEYTLTEQITLVASVRYVLGLTDAISGNNGSGNVSASNRDWQLLAGAGFRL